METYNYNELVANMSRGDIFMDELDAYIAPDTAFCPVPQPLRPGSHLPESPPDSGSENPYSPSERCGQMAYLPISPSAIIHTNLYDEQVKSDLNPGGITMKDRIPGVMQPSLEIMVQDMMDANRRSGVVGMGMQDSFPRYMREEEQREILPLGHQEMASGLHPAKKRKHSQEQHVKCEPATVVSPERLTPPAPPPPPSIDDSEAGDDSSFQCIRFQPFQPAVWHALADINYKLLTPPFYRVDADKGFNFSNSDEAYVCQKKNHFQVTCHVQIHGEAHYVKTQDGYKKVNNFFLHFYGVKVEAPNQTIKVEQSQSDRSKKPFHPVLVELRPAEVTKLTVGRLHFAETTCNNMRKKGKPNPDQRHFQLVVALHAHTDTGEHAIAAHASDRIIVRASNPGQFESDCPEGWWQRGMTDNSLHYSGKVGINTDRPDEACVIHGNLKVTGHIVAPSDARAKHNVVELDTAQQLKNVQNIRVVQFNYDPSFAEHSGLLGVDPSARTPHSDTGVIAQEVRRVLPEAVKEAGDVVLPNGDTIDKFLVVNKERIFMENLGAVKELCKVTGHLESRVHRLERAHRRICRTNSAVSNCSRDSGSSASNSISGKSFLSDGNISLDQIREVARNIRRHECCQRLSHNSPKYHRKQCRSCMKKSEPKYAKYYHTNKTFKSDEKEDFSTLGRKSDTIDKCHDVIYDSIKKVPKTNSCLWIGSDDSEGYRCRENFSCCRKQRYWTEDNGDFFSNKFIQVVITILILIMAICLAVMSVLYFREHRERVAALQLYSQQQHTRTVQADPYRRYAKREPPAGREGNKYRQNGIQNGKPVSQQPTIKKTVAETTPKKVTNAKATREHTTLNYVQESTSTEAPNLLNNVKTFKKSRNSEGEDGAFSDVAVALESEVEYSTSVTRDRLADTVGRVTACLQDNSNWVQSDDNDCQIYCCPQILNPDIPDPDGLESIKSPIHSENPPNTSYILYSFDNPAKEKPSEISSENNTAEAALEAEPVKIDNAIVHDSAVKVNKTDSLGEEKRYPEDLYVKTTENEMNGFRSKRQIDTRSSSEEGYQDAISESDDGCSKIIFGVSTDTYQNSSVFSESVCDVRKVHNITYAIPISRHAPSTSVRISFRTSTTRKLRLQFCNTACMHGNTVYCSEADSARESGIIDEGENTFSVPTICSEQRTLVIRGHLTSHVQNVCHIPPDHIPDFGYIQYNIALYRDCQN